MKYFISLLAFFFILGKTYSQAVITAAGPTTFCESKSVVLSVTGAPGGSGYQWTLDGKNILNATSASYTARATGSYSVVVTTGGIPTTLTPVDVIVKPLPVANFSVSSGNNCASVPVTFTNLSTGGETYLWNFGDVNSGLRNTSASKDTVHRFVGNAGNGTQNFTVTLVVTDNFGCTASKSMTVAVKQSPDTRLGGTGAVTYQNLPYFKVCASVPSQFNFTNLAPANKVSNRIIWGDGSLDYNAPAFSATPHTYDTGTHILQYIATGGNGCTDTSTYRVFVGDRPKVGVAGGANDICTGTTLTFSIDQTLTSQNASETIYTLTFNDKTPPIVIQHPPPLTFAHTFDTTSCGAPVTGNYSNSFYFSVVASNACSDGEGLYRPIYVSTKPVASFSISPNDTTCVGTAATISNTSFNKLVANSSCADGNSVWSISPATGWSTPNALGNDLGGLKDPSLWTPGARNLTLNFTAAGTYSIKLKTGTGICGIDSIVKTICVNPVPAASFVVNRDTGCAPFEVAATSAAPTVMLCGNSVYSWSVKYVKTAGCFPDTSSFVYINGTGPNSLNPQFRFLDPGTYTISLSVAGPGNVCSTTAVTKTIVVRGKPSITINTPAALCQNQTFTPSATAGCYITSLSKYQWNFPGGKPDTSTMVVPPNVLFSDTGQHIISLKVSNVCGDTTVFSKAIPINPPPNVIAPNDTGVCANLPSGAFNFTSSATGTTYSWINNNTSIGLAASGTGNITSFKTLNTTALPVTATVKVTATKNGCTSPADSFKITVYPTPANPTVTQTTVTYCQGDAAVPLAATVAAGDTLIWYTTSTGGTGSRTPPIPQTTIAGNVTYYVSQKNSSGCESGRSTITVMVGAKPKITTFSFTNPTSCGATDGTITLSGLTPNTSYTVQYTRGGGTPVSVPMTTNAAGNIIIRALGAGAYTNVGAGSAGCFATVSNTFELVEPNAPPAPKAGKVDALCSGNPINLTASTTLTGAITFSWKGPNGFTSGNQNPVINPATVAASGTYYVEVKQNGCTSLPDSLVVSVIQTPARPTVSASISLCSKDTLKLLASLDPNDGITYLWSGPNGFTSTQQNPAIPNASTVNNGTYSVTATRGNCVSPAATSIVSVKPAATITGTSFVHPSCGATNGTITLNGLSSNTTYPVQYTKNGTAVSTTALSDATGTIILRSLDAGTYAGIIVLTNGCPSNAAGPITLQNTPAFTASPASNSPLCIDNALQLKAGSIINENAVYSWTGPNGFKSSLRDPVIAHVSQSDTGTYYVTVTVNGCSATGSVAVTVLQNAIGGTTDADATVCSGTNTGNISLSGSSGRIVRWESSVNNGATWNAISNTSTSFTYNNLVATTWFRVLVQNAPCNPVFSDTTIITVNTNTEVPKFDPFSLSTCSHDTTIRFTATVNNPGNSPLTFKWFINDQIQGVSNPFSYRFRVPIQSVNAAQFNIKVLAEYSTGCGDTSQTGSIKINPLPQASINVTPGLVQYQPNYSFIFRDTSASNTNRIHSWNMGDGNQRSGKEVTYEYGDVGNYLVRLNVNDIGTGCTARDSVRIIIIPVAGSLYVPNAFYPNSKKNELTTFKLAATGLEKFHLQVFDTWGKLLFETTELNPDGSPKVSWNGTYFNNGTPLPQDAYVWKIVEAKFKNGKDWEGMSYNGGLAKRIGTVTLFR